MALEDTGELETEAKVQYLRMLVREDALRQFYLLSADIKDTDTPLDVDYLLKSLAWYFPL